MAHFYTQTEFLWCKFNAALAILWREFGGLWRKYADFRRSVAVLKVEFAFWGRILCFCRTVDLVVLNLKSDRSKFCKLCFWRNHGYKNQALPFGVNWQPYTRQAPQSYDTYFYIQPKIT